MMMEFVTAVLFTEKAAIRQAIFLAHVIKFFFFPAAPAASVPEFLSIFFPAEYPVVFDCLPSFLRGA